MHTARDEDVQALFDGQVYVKLDEAETEREDFVAVSHAQEVTDLFLRGVSMMLIMICVARLGEEGVTDQSKPLVPINWSIRLGSLLWSSLISGAEEV